MGKAEVLGWEGAEKQMQEQGLSLNFSPIGTTSFPLPNSPTFRQTTTHVQFSPRKDLSQEEFVSVFEYNTGFEKKKWPKWFVINVHLRSTLSMASSEIMAVLVLTQVHLKILKLQKSTIDDIHTEVPGSQVCRLLSEFVIQVSTKM